MMKYALECLLRKRNSKGILPSSSSSIRCIAQKKNMCSSSSTQTQTAAARTVPRERVECVVIGAGVVGLAVARELALRGRQVLVLDSAPTFGTATSSRNSEVIHAGIYYPPNSLKVSPLFSRNIYFFIKLFLCIKLYYIVCDAMSTTHNTEMVYCGWWTQLFTFTPFLFFN